MKIIKRSGSEDIFDAAKIVAAIRKANDSVLDYEKLTADQIEEIARMYRVPLHMIGDLDHATFSNVEHLSLDFVKYIRTVTLY